MASATIAHWKRYVWPPRYQAQVDDGPALCVQCGMGNRDREGSGELQGLLILVALSAWAAYLAYRFHSSAPPIFLPPVRFGVDTQAEAAWPGVLFRLAGLAVWSRGLLESGRWLMRRYDLACANPWEEAFLSFGLGYGSWGSFLFLLGLAGLWRPEILAAIFLSISFWGAAACVTRWRKENPWPGLRAWRPSLLSLVAGGLSLAGGLYAFRYTLVPETAYDPLQYHLALPNRFLLEHGIVPIPENTFSGIPHLPSMLFALTLAVDPRGIMAGMLHGSLLFWIALGFMGLSRRLGRAEAGPLAGALFILTPTVQIEAFRVSVGLEGAMLQLASLSAFFAASVSQVRSPSRRGWLALLGIFLGLVMTVKYPAWIVPLAFIAVGVGFFSFQETVMVLGIVAFVLAPWVMKNIWFYGNPIYPYLHEWISPGAPAMQFGDSTWPRGLSGFLEYLAHPLRLATVTSGFPESMGPAHTALLPLVFLGTLSAPLRKLGWICAATWIPLSLIINYPRYHISNLAAVCLLLACAAVGEWPRSGRRFFAFLACALCALSGWEYMRKDTLQKGKLEVLAGRLSAEYFLAHTMVGGYPNPAYAGIDYINSHAAQDARVLVFGDSRSFYLRRPAYASSFDQTALLAVWADSARDPESLKQKLRSLGIAYILVNYGEVPRLRETLRFSPEGKMALDAFWKRYTLREFGVRETPDRWVAVYRVLSDSEASRPHATDDLLALCGVR